MKKRKPNQGAKRLRALGTSEDLAARIGCKREQVAYWRTGARIPSSQNRERLCELFGIPVASWDEGASVKPTDTAKASTPIDYIVPRLEADDGTVAGKARRLDRLVRKMLDAIEQNTEMTDFQRFQLATDVHRLLDKLGKLTGESAVISVSRVLRLPAWRRIQDTVLDALKPHPKALAAVIERVERLGGGL